MGLQERPAKTIEWQTPPELFDALDKEFGPFTCDPAARVGQHTADVILSRGGLVYVPSDGRRLGRAGMAHTMRPGGFVRYDGLNNCWRGRAFLNPPYGREIEKWIAKAVAEVDQGHCERVVALLPARPDTRWWQRYVGSEVRYVLPSGWQTNFPPHVRCIRFLSGRVRFVGPDGVIGPPQFGSAVVVWGT